ncbi:unnamed protein product [Menidia menidia]|uniref:(Atlantic silverside) hypothetical protein n=1 Tax=Menidia menidia TaxID=238744 RepID=A0A8S4BFH0_9TELE|nr:unnamed protein product [Menidia menidia]
MATMEKLMKAFESLKSFQQQQGPPSAEELVQRQKKEQATTKKDRVTHCLTICENIVAQSLRTSPEFQKLLGIAMEMFLLCSDDSESDVRMVADECLNKIIKALMDSNLPRLQLELYKEIKKNGASRSLRAALWRFAELAHLIRPQKCRPYLVNLLPCLTRIAKRQEESVQETLAAAIPKMMSALGHFANDGEVKVLLRSFVANLKSSSPTIRRTAASSAVSVCQHSRRTSFFYTWLLNVLLGLLVPVDEEHPSHLILGVLLTLRYLMPLLQQHVSSSSLKGSFGLMRKEADVQPTPEQLLQVYELTLHYTQHWDHNVVTAALELLQQIFRTPPPELLHMLITAGSIAHASVFRQDAESRARSGSILELIGTLRNHWFFVCVCKVLDGSESQYSGMQIGTLQDEEDEGAAPSSQEEPTEPFLQSALALSKPHLFEGREVRVSVKALAVSCVGAAAALHPEAFFNSLYLEPLDGIPVEEQQYISDVLGLVDHGDPQIRGATAILCGAIIQAALTKTRYNHCIMTLCSSTLSELGLQVVIDLFALKDCSYWLVRTELLETLAELDFRLVPKLFYDCDQGQVDPVVAIARDQSSVHLQLLMHETQPPSQFTVSTITRTYRGYNFSNSVSDVTLENNLSRVVTAFGCCEALCLLASNFPVGTWSTGWHCGYVSSCSNSSSRSNLNRSRGRTLRVMIVFLAVAPKCLRNPWAGEEEGSSGSAGGGSNKMEEPWAALSERPLVAMVEQLFSHLLKVLNICAHVLDDTSPGPAAKASLTL